MSRDSLLKTPIIDLFAGAGGLALGGELAGGETRLSVEIDNACCETLRHNRPNKSQTVLEADVCKLTGSDLRQAAGLSRNDALIVVGGPPCQPFSKAAYWTDSGEDARFRRARAKGEKVQRPTLDLGPRADHRRDLVKEFVRIVRESRAEGFVFENVPSILHPRNLGIVDELVGTFRKDGYFVTLLKGSATDFGVPQRRHRVFILGHKRRAPLAPIPTHSHALLDGDELLPNDLLPLVTAGAALEGLGGPEYFEPEELVVGRWAEHLKSIPPGWNYKWHTAWAGHQEPTFEAETRFWNFLLKLSPGKPSWTLAASPGPWVGPFHWDSRRLRTVELAVLQGFSRDYHFCGPKRERVRQIGNAVPPPLAAAMIKSVLHAEITREECPQKSNLPRVIC